MNFSPFESHKIKVQICSAVLLIFVLWGELFLLFQFEFIRISLRRGLVYYFFRLKNHPVFPNKIEYRNYVLVSQRHAKYVSDFIQKRKMVISYLITLNYSCPSMEITSIHGTTILSIYPYNRNRRNLKHLLWTFLGLFFKVTNSRHEPQLRGEVIYNFSNEISRLSQRSLYLKFIYKP